MYNRLNNGERIKVEYGDEKKLNHIRKYFPKHLERLFSIDEIVEIIAYSMDIIHDIIHNDMSASGMGVVKYLDSYNESLIQYWMERYV